MTTTSTPVGVAAGTVVCLGLSPETAGRDLDDENGVDVRGGDLAIERTRQRTAR